MQNHHHASSFRALGAFLFCAFFLWVRPLAADAPADYYQSVTSQTGTALKTELRAIISGQRGYTVKSISYDAARDALLNSVDNVGGGQVRMLYTNDHRPTSQWAISINREHCWPQSFGASATPKVSDMHHLYLCDDGINSSRGNDLYGYVTGGTASPNFTGLTPDQNYYKDGIWQASPRHRGDVARAILYMEVRYSDFSLISRGQTLGSKQMGYLDDLLLWHAEDAVDPFEQTRNDRVFAFQNNRNPFVDHPEWVAVVYGSAGSSDPAMSDLVRTPTNPDISQTVSVSVTASDPDGLASVQLFWRTGTSGSFSTINMTTGGAGVYTTVTPIPVQPEGTVVQYYARAVDTLINVATLPSSGSVAPDSYTVRGNTPVLSDLATAPSTVTAIDPANILATVIDDDGNTASNLTVTAHWRLSGSVVYTSIPMAVTSGTTWQTTTPIPAQAKDTIVEYYVRATDAGSTSATIPAEGPTGPASYLVEDVAPFIQITSAPMVAGKLMLTELAQAVSASATTEFVELVNVSSQGYILDNVILSDDGVGATTESYIRFPTGSTIEPGGIIVVFNRAAPDQAFIDTIPPISNLNDAAVQVFVLDGARTFNGTAVPAMVRGDGAEPQLSNGDNMELVYKLSTDLTEAFADADVIDGLGWGAISTANTTVGWGPGVTTSGTATTFNVVLGGADGAVRSTPIDTDTKDDWAVYTGADPYTPGVLPTAFEPPTPSIALTGTGYDDGTKTVTVTEGASEALGVSLASNPGRTVTVSVARSSGSADFTITSGANLTFTVANFATPQTVTIAKAFDANTSDDSATFEFTGSDVVPDAITAAELEVAGETGWNLY